MKNVLGAFKLLSLTIVSGAVGAGLIFMALDSDEILGAAAGKKAAKKKKPSNIWNEVARDLAPTPTPVPNVQVPQPNMDLSGPVRVELPDEPLLDPRDPELCSRNVLVQDNGTIRRTVLKGEVRGYHQDINEDVILCEVEIYPRGCENSFQLMITGNGAKGEYKSGDTSQMSCQTLAEQYKNRKEIYVEAVSQELDFGVGGKQRSDVVQSYSLYHRTMDDFLARIAIYQKRAADREANRIIRSTARGIGGLLPK